MAAVHDLYKAHLLRSRAGFLGSLTELKGKVVAELNGLAGELDRLLETQAKGGIISAGRLKFIEGRIKTLVPGTTEGISSLLDNQMRVSIKQVAIGKQKAAGVFSYYVKAATKEKGILKIPEINVAFGGGMANFTEELVKQVWDKRWADGKKLSQRVWNFNRITERDLLRKVKSGVEEGAAARKIAKGLRPYLTGEGKGSPVYRSMRIARTECNEAYNSAHDEIAKRETFVKGTKWNLSGSHKVTDICDDYAEGGPHGDGVYPVGEVPGTPHPLCLCFRTDETLTPEEFLNREIEVPETGWVDKSALPDKEYADYLSKASKEVKPVGFDKIESMRKLVPHRPIGRVPGISAEGPITGDMAVDLTRKNFMRKLGFAKQRVAIEKGLDGWAFKVDSPRACWLRAGVNKMYGVPWKEGLSAGNVESLNNIIAAGNMPVLDTKAVRAIKAYKAYTHAVLKARGIEKQVVWRGIGGEQGTQVARAALTKDMVKIKVRSLTSFSNFEEMATDFANQKFVGGPSVKRVLNKGVVFKKSVKAQNIFFCPEVGGNLPPVVTEAEVMVVSREGVLLIDKNNIKIGKTLLERLVKKKAAVSVVKILKKPPRKLELPFPVEGTTQERLATQELFGKLPPEVQKWPKVHRRVRSLKFVDKIRDARGPTMGVYNREVITLSREAVDLSTAGGKEAFYHELGHAVQPMGLKNNTALRYMHSFAKKDPMARAVSQYALESYDEFWAENFAYYVMRPNVLKGLNPEMYKFIAGVLGVGA